MSGVFRSSATFRFGMVIAVMIGSLASFACEAAAAQNEVIHSMFSGSLIQPNEEEGEILRRFEVALLSSAENHFFHVSDDLRTGVPWPESFGITGRGLRADSVEPHLNYTWDGTAYLIPIPPLVVKLPDIVEEHTFWEEGDLQMTAIESRDVNKIKAWIVEARERRGRRQLLTVDAATGLTLRAEADVFMGQGERFQLTLARSVVKPLELDKSDGIIDLENELLLLQVRLKRRPDSHQSELTQRQTADVLERIEQLTSLSQGTPLEELVRRIKSDVEQQQKRLASAADRANQLINSGVPEFTLNLVSGGTLESSSLKGKTVILHFWDYRDSPLTEPYGQTGYLEFLFNKRRAANVEVVGISTNADLQTSEFVNRGCRAARKLSEFMNLTYPIGYDKGHLIETFGDPRDSKGQLPLWIVVSPDGKIAHYHAGFYEVDASQGLKELDAVLAEQASRR